MMFQPDLETMDVAERRDLQDRRLTDLVGRLRTLDNPWWQAKLAGVGEVTGVD